MLSAEFLASLSERVVPKVWGIEYWVVNSKNYCFKFLSVNPGFRCSLHYHPIKDETFTVFEGFIDLEIAGRWFDLTVGEGMHIFPGEPHRFQSLQGALIGEISTHHSDEDVVRLEPSGPIPDATKAANEPRPPASFPKV